MTTTTDTLRSLPARCLIVSTGDEGEVQNIRADGWTSILWDSSTYGPCDLFQPFNSDDFIFISTTPSTSEIS